MSRLAPRAALVLALATAAVALGLRWRVLGDITHGPDAAAYRYQARVLASGRWTGPATEFDQEFDVQGLIVQQDGRRFAIYSPGWPLVLAAFVRVGAPGLADATLAAVLVLLVHRLGTLLWPAEPLIALTASALAAVSPFVGFMGASGLSHLPSAVGVAAATVAGLRALSAAGGSGAAAWGAGAGIAAGFAFLCRPYSGLLGALEGGLVCLAGVRRRGGRAVAALLGAVPAGLATAGFLLVYNAHTTGAPTTFGYYLNSGKFSVFGSEARIFAWRHVGTHLRLFLETADAGVWGGLLPDLWLLALAPALRRTDGRCWALLAAVLVHGLGYAPYYFFDLYFGPRNLFEAMPWVLLLTAAGAVSLVKALAARSAVLARAALAVIVLHFGWGVAVTYPTLARYYAANYWADCPSVIDALRRHGFRNGLVLVRNAFYMSLHDLNAVDPGRGALVVARATTPERVRRLLAAHPDREAWVLDYRLERLSDPYYERWARENVLLTPPVAVRDLSLARLERRPESSSRVGTDREGETALRLACVVPRPAKPARQTFADGR